MPRDPTRRNLLPSVQAKLRSIRGMEKSELQLMLRIGNLVDATVQAARGLANVGEFDQRTLSAGVPVPQNLDVNSALDGIDVNFDAVDFNNFAHYEVQIDDVNTFADPLSRVAYSNKFTVRGLDEGIYYVRLRTVARDGAVSEWTDFEEVVVGSAGFDEDSDVFLSTNRASPVGDPWGFNNETVSKTFLCSTGDQVLVGLGCATTGHGRVDPTTVGSGLPSGWAGAGATLEENDTVLEEQLFSITSRRTYSGLFYTFTPKRGFDLFYLSGFYIENPDAYILGTAAHTFNGFFLINAANAAGNRTWDVTWGEQATGGFRSSTCMVDWIWQAVVKF